MLPNDFYNEENEEFEKAVRDTQAFKKFLAYGKKLVKDEGFMKEIVWFRKHWTHMETNEPLPLSGIPVPEKHTEELRHFYDRLICEDGEEYFNDNEYIMRETEFRSKYGLDIFGEAFDFFLFYGSVEPMKDMGYCSFFNVLNLIDETDLEYEHKIFGKQTEKSFYKKMRHYAHQTPIAILVHPFMTQNDIVDAIQKVYKTTIEPKQKRFERGKITVDKNRTSPIKIKERNDFIYKNRKLHIRDLTSLVNQKFRAKGKFYDSTYIQSLLSKEKHRRKISGNT